MLPTRAYCSKLMDRPKCRNTRCKIVSKELGSRQSAVDTLLSLGSRGRLVGVISHAQGLQERIPKTLLVTVGAGGSRAVFQ